MFKLYRQNLRNSPVYKECQQRLLENEIEYKMKASRRLKPALDGCVRKVKENISWFDFVHVNSFIDRMVDLYKSKVIDVHKRKFVSWGGIYNPTTIDVNKCIFNFSDYVLGEREKFLLSLGLNFCVPSFNFPKKDFLLYFEYVIHKLQKQPIFGSNSVNDVVNSFKVTMSQLPRLFRYTFNLVTKSDIGILKKLKQNNNIVICKPDKGNGSVLMNKRDYLTKMENILNDESKFRKIEGEDIYKVNLNMEDKINYQMRKLKRENIISEDEYNRLFVSGSSPSVMYGQPKVHKDGIPLRPILAAFKTSSYKLAKYLIKFLQPLTINEFTLNNSYEFKHEISQLVFQEEVYLASFDITSLFTNVPVRETMNIALNSLYETAEHVGNMTKNNFKKLLELCINDNHFIFNEEHYIQHEGFAMGSPLSATMANLFLCHHEINWLNDCPHNFKPILYKRYVDDTFLIFKKREHIEEFCNYLNGKHPNIQFTKEYENEGKLSFLDVNVSKKERGEAIGLNFNIFRKGTFTGLGMNYFSYTYYNFKINNIKTLVFRAYHLCSTWCDFNYEIQFLLQYFKTNGYPEKEVFKVINKFLNLVFYCKPKVPTAEKLQMYIKFPFLSNSCCDFIQKQVGKVLNVNYPHIDFKFLFVNNATIQGILNHKERLPKDLISGLVYSYLCDACGATYIGCSKRCLRTRIGEHFGISARTGSLLARPAQSVVRDHVEICGSSRSADNFKVLRTFGNHILLKIYESLEISINNPCLNQDESSYPLLMI